MPTELTPAELDAIRARHEAATPGPYEWDVRPDSHSVMLESKRSMAPLVMTFARWGMTNAAPEFCVDGNLRHVKEMLLPIPGREHHKWEKRIDHPDAIALEKSWEDRDALLSHIDALAAKVARLEGEQEQLIAAIEESNTAAKKATAGMNELFAGTRQIAERLGIHVAPND